MIYQKHLFTQKNNINKSFTNSIDSLNSFNLIDKNKNDFKNKQNTYSKEFIKQNNKLLYKSIVIKSYKINRKTKNDKSENNKSILTESNYSKYKNISNRLISSFDNTTDIINDDKSNATQDSQLNEITNKANKTLKMNKSHNKYFNYKQK